MSDSRQNMVLLHLAVLLFGVAGLFGKTVGGGAWVIVAGRTVFAALALLLFARWRGVSLAVSRVDVGRFLLSGALLAAHWWTFFHAIALSCVAVGLLGFASFPVFVALLEPMATGERSSRQDKLMIALVTVGLLLVVPEYRFGSAATQGLLWAVLSGLLFALLALANRKLAAYGPVRVAFWQNGVAALLLAPVGWPLLWAAPAADWWRLLLLGVVFTALAHGLFIASLRSVPARLAAVVSALEPVYGIGLAWMLFAEAPDARMLAGGAVILVATVWASAHHAGKPAH